MCEESYYALWHFLRHEGMTFKKSLRASEQDRPDVAFRRERWKARQAAFDPARLVFIDEQRCRDCEGQGPRPRKAGTGGVANLIPIALERRRNPVPPPTSGTAFDVSSFRPYP